MTQYEYILAIEEIEAVHLKDKYLDTSKSSCMATILKICGFQILNLSNLKLCSARGAIFVAPTSRCNIWPHQMPFSSKKKLDVLKPF